MVILTTMSEDPILQVSTFSALILIPLLSILLSKKKLKRIFIPSILSLTISFPMVIFVMIVPTLEISRYLFYISMSLWTGGFFSIFIVYFIYRKKKKELLSK